jgi:serine/threonine protein phosphatase PrpC
MNRLSVDFGSLHALGMRDEQQDRIFQFRFNHKHRFIMIDGMGGTEAGAEIAQRLVDALKEPEPLQKLLPLVHQNVQEWLSQEFSEVEQENRPGAVGTILELNLQTNEAQVCHLGDTRLYQGLNNKFELRTNDHTDENGKVLQDFGLTSIQPDWFELPFDENTQFVLCTDGLYEALDDNETYDLKMYFGLGDAGKIAKALFKEKSQYFNDNASAYFIRFNAAVLSVPQPPPSNKKILWLIMGMCLVLGLLSAALFDGFIAAPKNQDSSSIQPLQSVEPSMKSINQPDEVNETTDTTINPDSETPSPILEQNVNQALQQSLKNKESANKQDETQ